MCHHLKSETGNAAGAQNREAINDNTKIGLHWIYHISQTSKQLANQVAEEAGRVASKSKLNSALSETC